MVWFGDLRAPLLISYWLALIQDSYPGRTSDQAGSSCGQLPAGVWLISPSPALLRHPRLGVVSPRCPAGNWALKCLRREIFVCLKSRLNMKNWGYRFLFGFGKHACIPFSDNGITCYNLPWNRPSHQEQTEKMALNGKPEGCDLFRIWSFEL